MEMSYLPFELKDKEGEFLVNLARSTAKTYLETGKTLKPPEDTPKKLFENCGVFVTINHFYRGKKTLRGCLNQYEKKNLAA
jgi:AMMECR1 domain-containing protein